MTNCRLILVRSMRALAFAVLVGFGAPVCAGVFGGYTASGKIGEKLYDFTVSKADILRTPIWSPDADFPPLSARKAQEIARRQMQELLGGGKGPWVLREISIMDMGDSMHFVYAILFEPPPSKEACTMCDFMRIVVLMDGTVPKPTVRPLSP